MNTAKRHHYRFVGQPLIASIHGPQILDRAECSHRSLGDGPDPIAQALDQLELMARDDHRNALGCFFFQDVAHHIDGDGVETGERFVEDQDVGVVHWRGGRLHTLLVAQARVVDVVVDAFVDPEPAYPDLDPVIGLGAIEGAIESVELGQKRELLALAE